MVFSIKFLGIIAIVLCSAGFGFYKAASLRYRAASLSLLEEALSTMHEMIHYGNYELSEVLKESFKNCGFIKINGGKATCVTGKLNAEDVRVLEELFLRLGSSTVEAECERIQLCRSLIKLRLTDAQKQAEQECKIWQTGATCAGLAVGILFI